MARRFTALQEVLISSACLGSALTACDRGGTPPPFAVQPVQEVLAATDPQGTAPATGAPFLFTKVLKFRIPTGTVYDVSVNGWIVKPKSAALCGDEGCFEELARTADANAQTSIVIQVWPPTPTRFSQKAEFQITDVSLNSTATGSQLASQPLRLIIQEAIGPVLGGPPSPFGTPGTPEWASINGVDALKYAVIGESSNADAQAYYQAIDPTGSRNTLTLWKQANGFAADDSQDDAKATYFNAGDLGLGRSMHMKAKPNGDVAYYVSNYPTVEDALRRTNLIATVAMEYTPGPQGGARFMKFFVYGNDDLIAPSADLDGNGQKFVPNLCVICHGGSKYIAGNSPDIGSRFLPFDLASFQYSATNGRSSQEAEFKKLNVGLLSSNAAPAMVELVNEWYRDPSATPPNMASPVQNSDAVPGGWAGHEDLYLRVIRPSCRACHVSRDPGKDFARWDFFNTRGSTSNTFVCSTRTMPNAKVTYERFWLGGVPAPANNQVGVLKLAGVTGWGASTQCPQ